MRTCSLGENRKRKAKCLYNFDGFNLDVVAPMCSIRAKNTPRHISVEIHLPTVFCKCIICFQDLSGNCMILLAGMQFRLVQPEEISPYDYMWKLNFVPAGRNNFPLGIYLDLYAFSLNFSL